MSDKNWRKEFEIVWHGDVPPAGVEDAVRTDILDELRNLRQPSRLIFHTVFLSDDICGPSVSVWGKSRDRRFHAEYDAETKWVTLSGAELTA